MIEQRDATDSPRSRILLSSMQFGESPRCRDDRVWLADWGAGEVVAVDAKGLRTVMARVQSWPMSIDFLNDGRLLIVSDADSALLRQEADQTLTVHAELDSAGQWNEIVVDADDNIYLNNLAFDYRGGDQPAPGFIVLVRPDGSVHPVAEDVWFPNGMVLTDGGKTLVVAESSAHQLTAFERTAEGALTHRRVWADLGAGTPDGICVDAEGAIWYADPSRGQCVRVREGGKTAQVVEFGDAHACALGGRTLFLVGKERILTATVEVPA